MTDIYVLLIRTNTIFSRLIHKVTGSEYTHASISMTRDCRELYSFARKYANLPLPAGFVQESVERGLMRKCGNAPYALYRASVSKEDYEKLRERFAAMLAARSFHYSLRGPFFCFLGVRHERTNKYFCSQFVAEVLQQVGAIRKDKPSSLYHPNDFCRIKELELCEKGILRQLQNQSVTA